MDKSADVEAATSSSKMNGHTQSDDYFASYGDLSVHQLMLQDVPRTLAYKTFFEENAALLKDKIVMDVGAGTGILTLFAASVGAKKVIAVEASNMAGLCEKVVECNRFGDRVEVYHGAVEDIQLAEGTKVDVIVSEWMGFYLLHESMLDSVIAARDKYLAPGGVMAPSKAVLFVAPTDIDSYYSYNIEYWKNVYGFDFSPVLPTVTEKFRREPVIAQTCSSELLSSPQKVLEIDLQTVKLSDVQKISNTLNFKMEKSGTLRGFVSWFDVEFFPLGEGCKVTTLSTSPSSLQTHWKQTVFVLPEEFEIDTDDEVTSLVELMQDEGNKRHYNISIELQDVEDDYSDSQDCPVPCDCGAPKCRLIKTVMETYAAEHRDLEAEAEDINVNAEEEAVRVINSELSLESSDFEIVDK